MTDPTEAELDKLDARCVELIRSREADPIGVAYRGWLRNAEPPVGFEGWTKIAFTAGWTAALAHRPAPTDLREALEDQIGRFVVQEIRGRQVILTYADEAAARVGSRALDRVFLRVRTPVDMWAEGGLGDPSGQTDLREAVAGIAWKIADINWRDDAAGSVEVERHIDEILALVSAPRAVTWHSSDEDGGPDVGLSLGLGDGKALYMGELAKATLAAGGINVEETGDGWWFALVGGGIEPVALIASMDAAREMFDALAGALIRAPRAVTDADVERATAVYLACEAAQECEERWEGDFVPDPKCCMRAAIETLTARSD